MRRRAVSVCWVIALATLGSAPAFAQPDRNLPKYGAPSADADTLATVRITVAVMAGGTRLPAGSYDVRLTPERPAPLHGQSRDAERWVALVADGKVIAREVAEVLQDDDLPTIGASSLPVRDGTRLDMLKGGEFLRISVKRDRERYLIHLPVLP
jgi:hypothetical protein